MYPYVKQFSHVVFPEAAYVTKATNEKMWQTYRKKADFNGSSIATMVGLGRSTSRKTLWSEYVTGQRSEPNRQARDRIDFGEKNEAWGIRELQQRTNDNNICFWPTGTWTRYIRANNRDYLLAATPDQLLASKTNPLHDRQVLEVKMRKYDQHFEDFDLPPDWYLQVQMEMYCTGCKEGLLWCYSGFDNTFKAWKILEDKGTLYDVVSEAGKFLDEVRSGRYYNYPSKQLRLNVESAIASHTTCVMKDLAPVHPGEIEWGDYVDNPLPVVQEPQLAGTHP